MSNNQETFTDANAREYLRHNLIREWADADPATPCGAEMRAKIERGLGMSGAEIYARAIARISPPVDMVLPENP